MKRPNAVADLQKGEWCACLLFISCNRADFLSRYCNMDYIFHKSLSNFKIRDLVVSYDIACQWSIYLKTRLWRIDPDFAGKLFDDQHTRIKFLVPKFHLPAHVLVAAADTHLTIPSMLDAQMVRHRSVVGPR
jgi:hypothetical protein